MTGHFSKEAFDAVAEFFAEETLGTCDQKKKREARKSQRSPEQLQGDEARPQALQGKDTMPSSTRSDAAKKGSETRSKCKGSSPAPTPGVK